MGFKGGRTILSVNQCALFSVVQLCSNLVMTSTPTSNQGSGCGSVGRAVASNTRGPKFESSHWHSFMQNILFTFNCIENTKIKEKEAGNGPKTRSNISMIRSLNLDIPAINVASAFCRKASHHFEYHFVSIFVSEDLAKVEQIEYYLTGGLYSCYH